ncbi:Fic family protein [Aeromicrobium sp. YIM 150415]|uniref:Fic family protein n=1 Tax=Aeromicrobium sp. YIM 150415 TaxID=2803912 RepID=UPI0019665E59|nr:Fic family protein [Aeromicrobium sp. YIM 150415]MBM9462374.1 Fic family protein [Aeromicrobium sp. YIM 150415]
MGSWERPYWESTVDSGVPRAAQRSGAYRRYLPDAIDGMALAIDGDLSRDVAVVERKLRALNGPGAEGLAGIARFLLRSEAIASSRIEGIAPSAQQVAIAELGQSESVRGVSEQAQLVANNMTIVREATTELVVADKVAVEDIVELHRSLLPNEPRHHELRTVQNWIGTSDWSPIDAAYVPPDPDRVVGLMTDLLRYLNGAAHAPLVQAAIVHAQFETIHPFTDGNGRVGRALIHTVLARRGLTEQAVLPVSLVLATLTDEYITGLDSYRHDAAPGSPPAGMAINAWLRTFVTAAEIAVEQSQQLVSAIEELRERWTERLAEYRMAAGLRAAPRADSAVARVLVHLPEAPVLTATTLARILDVSYPAASAALDELRQAGVLATKSIERGTTAFIAREVLDLVTWSERALASTRFDTRRAEPVRPVPARPQR